MNSRKQMPVISIVCKPRDPTKNKSYSFNIPYKQVKNVDTIYEIGIMKDFTEGETPSLEGLGKLTTRRNDGEGKMEGEHYEVDFN